MHDDNLFPGLPLWCSKLFVQGLTAIVACTFFIPIASALELRNFRQLEGHFSAATGVPTSVYNVRRIAEQVRSGLPDRSDLSFFDGTYVRSTSQLAAAYCLEFISREARLSPEIRRAHSTVDFGLTPQEQTRPTVGKVLANYAIYFWDREISAAEQQILWSTASTIIRDLPQSSSGTVSLYAGLCSLVAACPESVVLRN